MPLLPLALVALSVQEPAPTQLPATLVTAPRAAETVTSTPAKRTVLTSEELVRTGESSLPRAIGRASGIWLQETNLGGGAPVIGGLMGNQILIVVDGVRLNDSTTRFGPNQSLNTIDPAIVERVEVLRGVRSLQYGSDAVGGAVLIWTKGRAPLGREADAQRAALGAGAEIVGDTASGVRASLAPSFATERHGLLAIGSGYDYHDLKAADGETVPNTGYDGGALFGAWEWATGPERTLRMTARAHRDHDVPRTDRMNAGFGQSQPSDQLHVFTLQDRRAWQLTYDDREQGGLADAWQLRLSLREYEERRDRQGTGSSTLRQETDEVRTAGIGIDWTRALGEAHRLTWGIDFEHDDVDSSRTDTNLSTGVSTSRAGTFAPSSAYDSAGVFVQDELLSLAPWYATAGLRWSWFDFSFDDRASGEEVSGSFDALVGSLEIARELGPDWLLTAGVAQGFRAPNLDDLANDGVFGGGTELGNPDLDPERSLTYDLTLAVEKPLWSATAGGWFTRIDDWVGRVLLDEGDPGESGDELYLRANTGEAEIWGLEGSFALKLGGEASPCSLATRAAYARGQQYDPAEDPTTGERPLYDVPFRRIPPLHGRVGLRYDARVARPWLDWAELYVLWADEQDRLHPEDVSDPRIDPNGTAGWATLNADVGGPLGQARARWNAGLHNILDQAYRVHSSGFDAPGIAFVFGLSASF